MKRARNKKTKKHEIEENLEKYADAAADFDNSYQDENQEAESAQENDIPFSVDNILHNEEDFSEQPDSDIFSENQIPFATDETLIDAFDPDFVPEDEAVVSDNEENMKKKKKKGKGKKIALIVLSVILILLIGLVVLGSHFFTNFMGNIRMNENDPIYDILQHHDSSKIEESENINILLLGVDEGGLRSDSIMLINYKPKTHKINLISIPRDTRVYVQDFDEYRKINALCNSDLHSVYGPAAVAKAITKLTGMPINYYMQFSFDAVDNIMNILGPVKFDVPDLEGKGRGMNYDDPVQDLHIHLKPGLQELKGNQIQQFLRYRKSNYGNVDGSDLSRVKRQQDLLAAIMDQKLNAELVGKFPDIFSEVQDGLKTTFTASDVTNFSGYLLKHLNDISSENMESFVLPGDTDTINSASYFICDLDETAELVNTSFGYSVNADELSNEISITGKKSDKKTSSSSSKKNGSSGSSSKSSSSSNDYGKEDEEETPKKSNNSNKTEENESDNKASDTNKDTTKDTNKNTSSSNNNSDSDNKKNNSSDKKEDEIDKKTDSETSKDTDKGNDSEDKKTTSDDSTETTPSSSSNSSSSSSSGNSSSSSNNSSSSGNSSSGSSSENEDAISLD